MFAGKWSVRALALVVLFAMVFGQAAIVSSTARADEETPAQRDARMKWWREARFGLFIHWGVYSVPAGTHNGKKIGGGGEWILQRGLIPIADYKKYSAQFNPVRFDADAWVRLAKEAGQKYIIITSKHHDGFAMFHSKVSDYNIVDATPFKRDPLKELADACKKHDMKLGFYYSHSQDWTTPGGEAHAHYHWDKAVQDGDFDKYLDEKVAPQVRELLTNYGKIDVFWWDTPISITSERAARLYPLLKLQPGILCNSRLMAHVKCDFNTPEQHIPSKTDVDWETCMTMNDTWGYKSYDDNWKSTETLVRNLIDIAGKGGNYLLNVGPTAEGEIPQPSVERLKGMGAWMKVNGEAIYGTTASPLDYPPSWGRITQKPGKLYFHVFDWPNYGYLYVNDLAMKTKKVWLLSDPDHKELKFTQSGDKLQITLPEQAPDKIASVIVVDYDGPLKVTTYEPLAVETQEQRDVRMKWWREARFGMFIHWGVYSVPGGTYKGKQIGNIGEWIMHEAKIPVADYQAFAKEFNPVKFDADEWVRLAKEAGQKYIVITSKHHDGFAMYHSKAHPYNIHDATPFKRDPLKELAAACKKHGVKLGFYHSQAQDWTAPGGTSFQPHWDKAQDGSMDKYLDEKVIPQVKEILTEYGEVAVLWWDTPVGMSKPRADRLIPLLKLQPNIVWNNRLGGAYLGDSETPEQTIPPTGFKNRDWETCMTMNKTWGYKSYDHEWKPTKLLLTNLIDIASKGGNYLLNVGPTPEGEIPGPSVERLKEMGAWLKLNGEAIYATTANPFRKAPPWGRVTKKPGKLYLHVFDWPENQKLTLPTLGAKPGSAWLLTDPDRKPLDVASTDETVTITVPKDAPDKIASVVVLEYRGELKPVDFRIRPAADGALTLLAEDSEIHGHTTTLEGKKDGPKNIGYWRNPTTSVSWTGILEKPGKYKVELNYSCAPHSKGTKFDVEVGSAKSSGTVDATSNWDDYQTRAIGEVTIDKSGAMEITVRPTTKPATADAVMNLRSVKLTPVK